MNIYYMLNVSTSDRESNQYIDINNCGYYENTDENMYVLRTMGRRDYQLIYIKTGEITFCFDHEYKTIGEGTVTLIKPMVKQEYQIKKGSTYYWIHFSGSQAAKLTDFFKEYFYTVGAFYKFEEFCFTATKFEGKIKAYQRVKLEGSLICLFADIAQIADDENSKAKQIVIPAINYMISNYNNPLTNAEYAKMCCVSKYYFIKLFKEYTGTTPHQYLTHILVEKAKYLFSETDTNVSKAASLLGFADSFYFSRIFKKHTGVSPSRFIDGCKMNR